LEGQVIQSVGQWALAARSGGACGGSLHRLIRRLYAGQVAID